jgi:ferredoxin
MPTIHFVTEKKQVQVADGANLRTEALRAGVKLYNGINGYGAGFNASLVGNCHGWGHCGTCRVLITKGRENVSPAPITERLRMSLSMARIGHEETMRLACCTKVHGDVEVVTCPELNLTGENFFS